MTKQQPQRRALRFDEWADVLADIESLQSHGYDRARRGNLSLDQICNHLAIVMEDALDGFPKNMPWPMRKLLRLLFLKGMMQHKQFSLRFPAPPFANPLAPVDDGVGAERLRAAIKRFSAPDATYVMHLAFGNLTPEQWNHQQLWHCEHHLSYLIPKGC